MTDNPENLMAHVGDEELITALAEKYNARIYHTDCAVFTTMVSHKYHHDAIWSTIPQAMRAKIIRGNWLERQLFREFKPKIIPYLMALTERPYRLDMVGNILDRWADRLDDKQIRDMILRTWVDAEIFEDQQLTDWLELFEAYEYELKDTLMRRPWMRDDRIHLYHGVERDPKSPQDWPHYLHHEYRALSWTLEHKVADKFARRFVEHPEHPRPTLRITLTKQQCRKWALFYTNKRQERELFFKVDPRKSLQNEEAET